MASAFDTSFNAPELSEKRPPFTVEYFNDEVAGLDEREQEHRRRQLKVHLSSSVLSRSRRLQALLGFESYADFSREFYRRTALYWRLLQRGQHLAPAVILGPYLGRDMPLSEHPHHSKVPISNLYIHGLCSSPRWTSSRFPSASSPALQPTRNSRPITTCRA